MVFQSYATYYDEFYRSKEYDREVDFVEDLAGLSAGQSILDLGCGTGGHAIPLAQRGYTLSGVDLSAIMLKQARLKADHMNLKIDFRQGDIRTVKMERTFDLVISMFAVMGYQVSNEDCLQAFATARSHLLPGGLFIFDAWYGPAVLKQRPETRISEFPSGGSHVIRMVKPDIDPNANLVKVHYHILRLADGKVVDDTQEVHPMRYFFTPEVELFAHFSGFTVKKICPFMEPGQKPDDNDWNVTWVLQAK
jgi:SAM-dependent methyltransferase